MYQTGRTKHQTHLKKTWWHRQGIYEKHLSVPRGRSG